MAKRASSLSPWQRRLLIGLTSLALLLILFFALLPFGLQYGIAEGLRSLGAADAQVEDVDFNPFKAVLVVHSLEVKGKGVPPLLLAEARVEVSWRELFQRRLLVENLYLRGLRAQLVHEVDAAGKDSFAIAGLHFPMAAPGPEAAVEQEPLQEAPAEPWGFGVDALRLGDIQAQYVDQGASTSASISTLEGFSFYTWSPQTLSRVHLAGAINDAPLSLSLEAAPLAAPLTASAQLRLTDFDVASVKAYFPPDMEGVQGHLGMDWRISLEMNQAQDLELMLNGETRLQGMSVSLPAQQLTAATEVLAINGETLLQRKGDENTFALVGGISHQGLQVTQGQAHAAYEQFQWDGELRLVAGDGTARYFLGGNALNTGFALSVLEGEKKTPLLRAQAVRLADLQLEDEAIAIGAIRLESCQVQVKRLADGSLYLPAVAQQEASAQDVAAGNAAKGTAEAQAVPQPSAQPAAAPETTPETTPETNIRIGEFAIEGDSRVTFLDESVSPHFRMVVFPLSVHLRNLDSSQKDKASSLLLSAKLNEYAGLEIEGDVFPFAAKPSVNLNGKIRALELPPLSSYTEPQLGYNLSSGHLNADLSIKIDQGNIDSENQLRIKQLKLEPSNPDKMEKFSKKLTMPLDAALSLLRDKDDNIKLKLPVKGDLESPDFDIADAINQSLGTAMKFAAMHYIKLALQPYGTLISLYQAAGTAGKMMTAIRMDPVKFAANTAQLDGEAMAYLQTSLKLLTERPKLNIKICGKASVNDYQALVQAQAAKSGKKAAPLVTEVEKLPPEMNERLLKLAGERGKVIKVYLVEQGVAADRLFVCHPEVDFAADSMPRAELLI